MQILEYIEDYKETVNNLMYEIMVEEFGFNEFKEGILNSANEEYIMGNNKLWLAIEDGEVIGTTGLIEVSDNHALLKKVYVKESHRGKGIAQMLLNQCLEHAKSLGYDYIFLETYERLNRAKSFYSRNGFIPYYDGYDKIQGEEIRYKLDLKRAV